MKYVKLFVGFLAAGIAFILAGLYISLRDIGDSTCRGSCSPITSPAISTIVGGLLAWSGIALLIVAVIIGLYGYFCNRKNVKPAKLEPKPAQVDLH